MTWAKTALKPASRTRRAVLGTALGGMAGLGLAPAFGPEKRAGRVAARARHIYDLVPRPVANGIWMVEGATEYFTEENGGAIVNVALLDAPDGLVVVDTGPSLRYGEAMRRAALQVAGKGVAAVVVTHHHPDHYFGNQAFADVPIHALPETGGLVGIHGEGHADNMYRLLGDWMRGTEPTPPNVSLPGGEVEVAGRAFTALPLGGHTGADLALLDRETGVLIAGDLAFLNRAPTTPDADLPRWRESLDAIKRIGAAAILPGHGPFDRARVSIGQTRAYLDWLEATLRGAAEEGLGMVEIMSRELPEGFAAMGAQPREFQRSISHLYPRIEVETLPLLNR